MSLFGNDATLITALIVIAAIFLSCFIYSYLVFGRARRIFKKLCPYFNGIIQGGWFEYPYFKGIFQGKEFSISFSLPANDSPPALTVLIFKSLGFSLYIREKDIFTNAGIKLGLLHEVKINDKYFVKSDDINKALSYLSDPAIKTKIDNIFTKGFHSFFSSHATVGVRKNIFFFIDFRDMLPENITTILQDLVFLAKDSPINRD